MKSYSVLDSIKLKNIVSIMGIIGGVLPLLVRIGDSVNRKEVYTVYSGFQAGISF